MLVSSPAGTVLALPAQKIFVVHVEEGFFALSAVCTHLGCLTKYEPENGRIFCPCHGSRFATDGKVAAGPAPAPLPRLELALDQGVLVVDSSKAVGPDFLLRI